MSQIAAVNAGRDQETRRRLLDAAAPLFAERGFANVTVRDICQAAGTNIAAVNYHFRDKLGLYKEVISSVAEAMHRGKEDALQAGEGQPPDEQLRTYIRLFLGRLLGSQRDSWIDHLIARELANPTPALDLIVERGIRPTAARLQHLVSQILGCSPGDPRVVNCACSIQGQCLFYLSAKPVAERMTPGFVYTPEIIDQIARHIADFSVAGIRALAANRAEAKP